MKENEDDLIHTLQSPKPSWGSPSSIPTSQAPKNRGDEDAFSRARKMKEKLSEMDVTPEERIRRALRLEPNDPTPQPESLSPELRQALKLMDPVSRHQILAVMGSIEKIQEKAQALTNKMALKSQANFTKVKNTSFAQRAIVHRANKGTLSHEDIALAKGMIANSGNQEYQDPKTLGLDELGFQTHELLIASHDLKELMLSQIPGQEMSGVGVLSEQSKDILFIEQSIALQMGNLTQDVQQGYALYQKSDLDRILEIVKNQEELDRTVKVHHRGPLPNVG